MQSSERDGWAGNGAPNTLHLARLRLGRYGITYPLIGYMLVVLVHRVVICSRTELSLDDNLIKSTLYHLANKNVQRTTCDTKNSAFHVQFHHKYYNTLTEANVTKQDIVYSLRVARNLRTRVITGGSRGGGLQGLQPPPPLIFKKEGSPAWPLW